MALVNCPVCNQQISEHAKICPICGLNIPKYNAQKQAELEEQKRLEQAAHTVAKCNSEQAKKTCPECHKEVTDEEKNCPYCGFPLNDKAAVAKAEEYNRTIEMLSKETPKSTYVISLLNALAFSALTIWAWNNSTHGSLGLLILISFVVAFFAWVYLFTTAHEDSKRIKYLELARRDFGKYEEQMKAEAQAAELRAAQDKKRWDAEHPQCPNCGSRKTKRISTSGRAISIAAVGLASGKIGKQYECKECKHMW